MKLKNFYIENKHQVRLDFENGTSQVVAINQLDQLLNQTDVERVKSAAILKTSYFKQFPEWLKTWSLVSVGALILLSAGTHANRGLLPWMPPVLGTVPAEKPTAPPTSSPPVVKPAAKQPLPAKSSRRPPKEAVQASHFEAKILQPKTPELNQKTKAIKPIERKTQTIEPD